MKKLSKAHAIQALKLNSICMTANSLIKSKVGSGDLGSSPSKIHGAEVLIALSAVETTQRIFRVHALLLIHQGHGLKRGWGQINPPSQQHQQFNEDVLSHPY